MCGRYAIAPDTPDAWADVGTRLGDPVRILLDGLEPRFNIAPSTQIPIVMYDPTNQSNAAVLARWGFIPHWWKEVQPPKFSTINARSEELADKPLWREAWKHHRCLIAATHWYEWQKTSDGKQAFALQPADGNAFLFAGLYSRWTPPGSDASIYTASILTRAASDNIRHIHDRMPVIVAPEAWQAWLGAEKNSSADATEILAAHVIVNACSYPVSSRVNSPRNNDPAVLQAM